MRISDCSSDVCPSDLAHLGQHRLEEVESLALVLDQRIALAIGAKLRFEEVGPRERDANAALAERRIFLGVDGDIGKSEEHTSALQSLMRISYAVFCLKKNNTITYTTTLDIETL